MAEEQTPVAAIDSTDFAAFKQAAEAAKKGEMEEVVETTTDDAAAVAEKVKAAKEAADKKAAEEAAAADENLSEEDKAAKIAADKKAADDAAAGGKKPKKTVSERIAEFRRGLTDAQEQAAIEAAETERQRIRAEKAEAEAAALRAGKKPDAGAKAYEPEEGEPKAEDYEFGVIDPAYVRDLTSFKVEKSMAASTQTQTEAAQKKEALTKFENTVAKGLDIHDDYLQVVVQGADQGKWRLSPVSAQALIDMDFGHEVAYHLASNPAEAADIADMPPHRQLLALGRLEARFATEAANDAGNGNEGDAEEGAQTTQKKVSAAPPPPKKVTKGNEGQFTASPDTKDLRSYRRLVEKHQASRN